MPEPDLHPIPASGETPMERAAIVLLSMGEEPAAAVLRCLSRPELMEVTQVMSRMSGIKVDSVRNSLQQFFDDYREQSGVHGASRSYLKRSLELALGSDVADSVLNHIYGDSIRPKMARLQWASPKWLAERIGAEHVRMQAMFLAFLPPALAGEVLRALPAEDRNLILFNMARLTEVDRELLVELDELVERCLQDLSLQNASVEGVRQVAEILNRLPDPREQVDMLRNEDPSVGEEIERSMYDFEMLSRQSEATLQRIVEAVPVDSWALALKGVEPAIRRSVLDAMPRRQAQLFEDGMRRMGPVPVSRAEAARKEVMDRTKDLADSGEIELQLFAEAVVE